MAESILIDPIEETQQFNPNFDFDLRQFPQIPPEISFPIDLDLDLDLDFDLDFDLDLLNFDDSQSNYRNPSPILSDFGEKSDLCCSSSTLEKIKVEKSDGSEEDLQNPSSFLPDLKEKSNLSSFPSYPERIITEKSNFCSSSSSPERIINEKSNLSSSSATPERIINKKSNVCSSSSSTPERIVNEKSNFCSSSSSPERIITEKSNFCSCSSSPERIITEKSNLCSSPSTPEKISNEKSDLSSYSSTPEKIINEKSKYSSSSSTPEKINEKSNISSSSSIPEKIINEKSKYSSSSSTPEKIVSEKSNISSSSSIPEKNINEKSKYSSSSSTPEKISHEKTELSSSSSTPEKNINEKSDFSTHPSPESDNSTNYNTTPHIKSEDDDEDEDRKLCSSKRKRSSDQDSSSPCFFSPGIEEEEKRKARLMRNRESAQLSRQRKKHYVEELEEKVKSMHSTISELNRKVSLIIAENASLRQQLGNSGNSGNHSKQAVYPAPMHFPWMGYPPRQQAAHVPLVPIPRLKQQQISSSNKSKKSDSRKGDSKKRKIASVSILGLLLCMVFLGVLLPGVKIDEKGGDLDFAKNRGRILSDEGMNLKGKNCSGNASEPLFASLYVPRNDKLVKIDGNLIIQSVMVNEKERTKEHGPPEQDRKEETRVAIAGSLGLPLPVSESRREMKEWFQEGLEGPILNSGMCTEVFSFEMAPAVPASNSTRHAKSKNRRALQVHSRPIPLPPVSPSNGTGRAANQSIVVNVLLDPREVSGGDFDGVISPKSIPRVFVVVLLDSVKYVTYSCVLPFKTPRL